MIVVQNISKKYEMGAVTVTALENVSLQINVGEFVVVLGPSGSGKSTLLNMMSGLDTPTNGNVIVNGQEITKLNQAQQFTYRRKTVSFIFQTFNLFPALTAVENVQFAVDMKGDHNHSTKIAAGVLKDVGLAARMQHFPHELSGGEQQRVAIARALATGNPILLADEPTGELDFKTGVQILQLLQDQAKLGKTVIVVTHNREISRIADRVIELSGGRIIRDGMPTTGKAPIAELHW